MHGSESQCEARYDNFENFLKNGPDLGGGRAGPHFQKWFGMITDHFLSHLTEGVGSIFPVMLPGVGSIFSVMLPGVGSIFPKRVSDHH